MHCWKNPVGSAVFGTAPLAVADAITCAKASFAVLGAQVVCSTVQLRVGTRETQPAGDEDTCQVPSQCVICEGLLQGIQSQEETRKQQTNLQVPLLSNALTASGNLLQGAMQWPLHAVLALHIMCLTKH